MQLLEWKDEFSLGIPEIDYEHRKLIQLINEMLVKIYETDREDNTSDYLGEIYARIALHFALEEKIMREKNYDQLADHKADHDKLLDEIRDIMDHYSDMMEIDTDKFVDELNHWFTDHFSTKDARLHRYLDM